jgi:hypothetical protein
VLQHLLDTLGDVRAPLFKMRLGPLMASRLRSHIRRLVRHAVRRASGLCHALTLRIRPAPAAPAARRALPASRRSWLPRADNSVCTSCRFRRSRDHFDLGSWNEACDVIKRVIHKKSLSPKEAVPIGRNARGARHACCKKCGCDAEIGNSVRSRIAAGSLVRPPAAKRKGVGCAY